VTYAPSAAVLTCLARRVPHRTGRSLVLGYGTEAETRAAEQIAALLGEDARTGPAAASSLLPGSWDIVHIAAQAVFDRHDPFASGVRLADGLLTARRLMSTRTSMALVAVTGCEHDSGSPPDGDGMEALGHALLHAGARSALLTLWPVAGEITRSLMRDFHTRLRTGTGPAQALREAVLGLRELYGPAEPDLWAPYVLVGLPDWNRA
jgi:CHAT domain-containing protein